MGWSHGDVSREDLLKLIKGFINMLILASGFQSSGRLAHWDSTNIKKAFQWALFLENGLRHVSSATLTRAKVLMLKHLVHTLPLRDSHFRASVTAITEMDIDGLQRIDDHCLDLYLEKLVHQASYAVPTWTSCSMEVHTFASPETNQSREAQSCSDCDFTRFAVQELGKRYLQVSSIAATETGLDVLSKITRKSHWNEVETTLLADQLQKATTPMSEEKPIEPDIWNHWKSRSLSYLLNKRTIRLASGANLFFSAPKHQWINVIERLCISDVNDDDMYEKIEILLLGRIVQRWSSLIKILMSNSYESITMSKLYHEVQNLPYRRFQNPFSKEDLNPEETGVLEYLERFLSSHFHCLWKLTPVLAAVAIPSRSPLFRSYITELESQTKGESSPIR